ncbi:9418_t:CDS:2 [Paraglomus occultum]|uniref:purine-nucleoside phosphorylase n=1 Tax=Paraglomus occultum TaxID=144539 RepID=A0A9N9G926_9GLOM|nr:9418_t:CDS:2 [Paraglomus occultum]
MTPPSDNAFAGETAKINSANEYLRKNLPSHLSLPKIAIICGSGLGGLAVNITDKVELAYEEIPGFVSSTGMEWAIWVLEDEAFDASLVLTIFCTVQGHAGKLVFGVLGKNRVPVVCMVGRFHFYEGYTLKQVTFPIRVFKLLGVEVLIVTGATGALNKQFKVGDIAVLFDHISLPCLTGSNPLIGPNLSEFGKRFIPISDAYDFTLRQMAFTAAANMGLPTGTLKEGTYCHVIGPSYESKAEARFLRDMGGDIVGMSTVPEVIVARHCGIRVLGLSLVTNAVVMERGRSADPSVINNNARDEAPVSHEEVLVAGSAREADIQKLVHDIVDLISHDF